jgi:hypothetical protein
LINSLILQGDLLIAERFAEQTYQNLRDFKNGMDQEGTEVAMGAYNLADVIRRQEERDLIKAEKLARESLLIRTRLYGTNDRSPFSSRISAGFSFVSVSINPQVGDN